MRQPALVEVSDRWFAAPVLESEVQRALADTGGGTQVGERNPPRPGLRETFLGRTYDAPPGYARGPTFPSIQGGPAGTQTP